MENVKIPASKMAAIKQSPVPPPPPLSFCEGPRILQNLRDVVFQIVELPLYILSFLPLLGICPNQKHYVRGRKNSYSQSTFKALKEFEGNTFALIRE